MLKTCNDLKNSILFCNTVLFQDLCPHTNTNAILYAFSNGIKCFTCSGSGCTDEFNSNSSRVKVEHCVGTCAKTKKYDSRLMF